MGTITILVFCGHVFGIVDNFALLSLVELIAPCQNHGKNREKETLYIRAFSCDQVIPHFELHKFCRPILNGIQLRQSIKGAPIRSIWSLEHQGHPKGIFQIPRASRAIA
jgi:hypothetical protein